MIFHQSHALAGHDIEERLVRIEARDAINRAKNRGRLIPDMEPQPHEPVEYFAELGYHAILAEIGQSAPTDYPEQCDDGDFSRDSDPGAASAFDDWLSARRTDQRLVWDYLLAAEAREIPHRCGVVFGCRPIRVFDRLSELKTWAARQTLRKIVVARQKAMRASKAPDNVMSFTAPIIGASGFDGRTCPDALDVGFSLDGVPVETRVAMELLALIGIETIPLTVYPDRRIGYTAGGKNWAFSVESRNDYYGRWGSSEEC